MIQRSQPTRLAEGLWSIRYSETGFQRLVLTDWLKLICYELDI